jgi:glycosyltransferase involved in cell wall biosynthesis
LAFYGGSVKKKILLKGPLLTRSGYGEQARFALRALRSRPDIFEVFIQPLQWGMTSWLIDRDAEREWIDQTIEKTIGFIQQGGTFDMSLQVTIPNEWEKLAPVNVGYTAGIETTKVAHQWIQKGNEMDQIIVVSQHSKQIFKNTEYAGINPQTNESVNLQLQTPIEFVNYPVKTFDKLPSLELDLKTDINFLVIAQTTPRKNLRNTIKWFLEEFADEEVGLIIKTNKAKNCLLDRELVMSELQSFVRSIPTTKCKVYLLHGDMTDEEMHALYTHEKVSAFLALPHGEGFGLPIFEAAYTGIPVVATGWSGQLDFLCDENGKERFYNVAFDLNAVQDEVVWDGVIIKESMWAYAREVSAKEKLRECYTDIKNDSGFAQEAPSYTSELAERFSEEKLYNKFVENVVSLREFEQMKQDVDDLLSDLL